MRYKTYCFGDLVEKWIDNRGKTPPLSENGIPLLEVKHLPESIFIQRLLVPNLSIKKLTILGSGLILNQTIFSFQQLGRLQEL